MRKRISFLIVVITLTLNMPAFAKDTVVIPGFTEISYPTEVKFGNSICKSLKFTYVNDEDLAKENSLFLIQILHSRKKITHGYGAWFSRQTSDPKYAHVPSLPRAGVIPIKLCKKKWTLGTDVNKTVLAATPPGTYRIYFVAGNRDPVTGAALDGKIEIFKTLKVF
jgi:hypothetical protein